MDAKVVGVNARGETISLNKNGFQCVYFKDRKPDFFPEAMKRIQSICAEIKASVGLDLFMMYGSILGPVREGQFIPHDDDFDLCYASQQETDEGICKEIMSLVQFLRERGYRVSVASFGFIQVYMGDIYIDVFVGWIRDGKFHLYWGIPDGIPADNVVPLSTMTMYGQEMPVPANCETVLEAIYGQNWRVPDPAFKYSVNVRYHKNFQFLINGWPKETGKAFWNVAYRSKPIPRYPSQFAISLIPELKPNSRILDIGCGNGRDAMFFAAQGHAVVGADASTEAIKQASSMSMVAQFLPLDLYAPASIGTFIERFPKAFDAIYARFFIHAIDDSGESVFWRIAKEVLAPDGLIFIETRTKHDMDNHDGLTISPSERITDHYRRFIDVDQFKARAEAAGFVPTYVVQGYGLAKYKTEDPHVLRATFRRAEVAT